MRPPGHLTVRKIHLDEDPDGGSFLDLNDILRIQNISCLVNVLHKKRLTNWRIFVWIFWAWLEKSSWNDFSNLEQN